MGSPETYRSGIIPQTTDSERMLLVKLIIAEGGGGGGGGGGGVVDVFSGHYGGVMPVSPTPSATATAALNYDLDPPFQTWKWDNVAKNWGA